MREPILTELVSVDKERRPLGNAAILRSMEQPLYEHELGAGCSCRVLVQGARAG